MGLNDLSRVDRRFHTKVTKELRRTDKTDATAVKQEDQIDDAIRTVLPPPFREGNLKTLVFDTLGTKTIPHGLGGRCEGMIVVDRSAAVDVFKFLPEDTDKAVRDTHAKIFASAACTVKIWLWK